MYTSRVAKLKNTGRLVRLKEETVTEDEKRATPEKVANDQDLRARLEGLMGAAAAERYFPSELPVEERNVMSPDEILAELKKFREDLLAADQAAQAEIEAARRADDEKNELYRAVGIAVALLLAFLLPATAQASPFAWNPFTMGMRADNTMSVRGAVTNFQDNEPLGGCSFELHHSDALDGVQVVLDATRNRDCAAIRKKLALVSDPTLARVIVKAKGRVVTDVSADGIGQAAREQLQGLLEGIGCTTTKGASPSLALDPLQRVKQEIDAAVKKLGEEGALALSRARIAIIDAQEDLEHAANLTGVNPVCVVSGTKELRAGLESLPAASKQTLHATGVQVDRD